MTRLALFDCDGTLVDSLGAIRAAMDAAFTDDGLPPPGERVRDVVGLSVEHAIAALRPPHEEGRLERLAESYRRHYRAARQVNAIDEPLYPGVATLLDRLAADGWTLGIATGKSRRGLDALLAHHGLADRFATLQTADRHPSKPDPAMALAALAEAGVSAETAVLVGDTEFDMGLARAAGLRAIGVAWGYHAPERLRSAGAERVARTTDELGDWLCG